MKKKIFITAILIPIFLLIGCTKSGDRISATYIDPIQYHNYDCEHLQGALIRVSQKVGELIGQLNKASRNDKWLTAAGVIILGPMLFALGGDDEKEAQLARLKGEYDALQVIAAEKKCSFPKTSVPYESK